MQIKPFVYILINLIIGIVLGSHFTITSIYLFVIFLAFSLISFFIKPFIWTFFIFIGFIYYQNYNQIPENNFQNIQLNDSYAEALILEKGKTSSNNKTQYTVEIKTIFNDSIRFHTSGNALVYLNNNSTLSPNTSILFQNNFSEIETPKNPTYFNFSTFLKNKRIYRQAFIKNYILTSSNSFNLKAFFNQIRESIIKKIELRYNSTPEVSIMKAMLLGNKSALSSDLKESYSKTGTMHLLAISGLHTGIVYGWIYLLFYFLQFLPKGKIIRIIASLLFLWFYASLTGFSASVLRASLIITLFQIMFLLKRDSDSIHTLSVSAFILLILNPNFLFDVGFQLSYAAVYSILLFFPFFQNHFQFKYKIFKIYYHAILISLIATLGTLPLVLYYFHSFPSLFLLSNGLLTPIFGLIMGLGLAVLFLLLLTIPIPFLETCFFKSIFYMNQFINWVYHLNLHIENISFSKTQVFLFYLSILGGYFFLKLKKYTYLYLSCCLLFCIQMSYLYQKYQHITTNELVIFNSYKNPIIIIKNGTQLDIFSKVKISKKEYQYIIQPYITQEFIETTTSYFLNDTLTSSYIKTASIFQFKNTRLLINPTRFVASDFIFITDPKLLKKWNKKNVITNRYHISDSIYQIPKKGAFRLQISF